MAVTQDELAQELDALKAEFEARVKAFESRRSYLGGGGTSVSVMQSGTMKVPHATALDFTGAGAPAISYLSSGVTELSFPGNGNAGASIVLVGDSITRNNNQVFSPSAISASGTGTSATITVTMTAHGLWVGARIFGFRADQSEYNQIYRVNSIISSSQFTVIAAAAITKTTPSFTAFGSAQYIVQDIILDSGWFNWLNAASGSPFVTLANVGVGGELASQFTNYITKYALPLAPEWVAILGGVNDASAGKTGAQIAASLQSAITTCTDAGIKVLFAIAPPYGTNGGTNWTGASGIAKAHNLMLANKLMREWCERNPMVLLIDAFSPVVDTTDTTGALWLTGYDQNDGLHPSAKGAWAIGTNAANVAQVQNATNNVKPQLLPVCLFDTHNVGTTSKQLHTNPILNGTGGTNSGGSITTTVQIPDNWTALKTGAGATCSCTSNARADGFGNDSTFVFVSSANNDNVQLFPSTGSHAAVSPGDFVYAAVEVSVSGITALGSIQLILEHNNGTAYDAYAFKQSGTTYTTTDFGPLVLRTNLVEITTGTISNLRVFLKAQFTGAGGATIKFGRCALYKYA